MNRLRHWLVEHALLFVGAALALPIVLFPYPPMTDFPSHEAIVAVLRHRHEAAYQPDLYQTNWGHPNQLFHLLAWALSYAMPITLACKIVVAGSIAAIFYSTGALARHLGRSRWVAFLAAPVVFGWLFFWGFVTLLLGLAVLLAVLPVIDRFTRNPSPRGLVATLACMLLLYEAHELVLFISIGVVGLFTLRRYDDSRARGLASLPIAFAVSVAATQAVLQRPLIPPSAKFIRPLFPSLLDKLKAVPPTVDGQLGATATWTLFTLSLGLLIAFAAARARFDSRGRAAGWRDWMDVHRFEALALSCFVLYWVSPFSLLATTYLHYRFLVLAWCLAVPISAPKVDSWSPSPGLTTAAASLPLIFLALLLPHFGTSSRLCRELGPILERIEPGSSVANVSMSIRTHRESFYDGSMMSNRVVTERGGRVMVSFFDSPISPVYIKRQYQWNDVRSRNDTRTGLFRPAEDLEHFDYLLLRSADDAIVDVMPSALTPEADPILEVGDWHLFRSRVAHAGPISPDWRTPRTLQGTLFQRMLRAGFQPP